MLEGSGWRWRALVTEAMFRLTLARLLVRLAPFGWWRHWLGQASPMGAAQGIVDPVTGRLVRAVLRGAARLPFQTKCLPRAIALHMMLRSRKLSSRLVIAVLDPRHRGALDDLHAWVESGGQIVIGEPELPFHPIITYS